MIRLLVKFGKWLDKRFPEKLVVKVDDYEALHTEISLIRGQLNDNGLSLHKALERLSVVENNAVHKQAVQDLIQAVKVLKDEYVSLKASLGMNRIGDSSIRAMLNGEPLGDNNE